MKAPDTNERSEMRFGVTPAAACRWLGVAAVAMSGAIYLLQGVREVDVTARNWVYLALIAALGAGGVVSRLALADAKGARVFFALAVALVPVQFSQVAGMLHELVAGPGSGPAAAWFDFRGVTPAAFYTVATLTALAAVPVSYLGFSVLARAHAPALTGAFVALCASTLLPGRASADGFAVLAALAGVALLLEYRWFSRHVVFQTLEGRATRAMFLLPLAIVAGRAAFHVDTVAGYCVFTVLCALFVLRAGVIWLAPGRFRAAVQLAAVLAAAGSWLVYVTAVLDTVRGGSLVALALLPIALLLLDVSRFASAGSRAYRYFASVMVVAVALALTLGEGGSLATSAVAVVAGAALCAWGVLRREREPTVCGAAAGLAGVVSIFVRAIAALDVTSWVSLALLGMLFLFGSSALERHGRRISALTRGALAELRDWS